MKSRTGFDENRADRSWNPRPESQIRIPGANTTGETPDKTMYAVSPYSALAMTLAALFGVIGLVHLAGPRFLRAAYDRWDYPQRLRLIVGLWEVIAAGWLADPAMRGWGITVAAAIDFGAIVTLFGHAQYRYALPALAMMAALVPAAQSVPRDSYGVRFAPASRGIPAPQLLGPDSVPEAAKENSAGV